MKFQSDLKFGQIYEKEFIKIMGFQTYKHETNKAIKEYDIIVKHNGSETKYEIKADRLSYKTGNVYIEIANVVDHRESHQRNLTIGVILLSNLMDTICI